MKAFPLVLLVGIILWTTSRATAQWSHDATANNIISAATSNQYSPTVTSDGSGGAIITWYDYRAGNYDIYAQRISSAGVAQWTTNGVPISTAANSQDFPMITSDGAGGAIITWEDDRSNVEIYAQRINSAGVVQWTANGVAISTAANTQGHPMIDADGSGGAIITWEDYRSGTNFDIYAQRINSAGVVQWTANGVAISTTSVAQGSPKIASDGSGGAIVTWHDGSAGGRDIYAQRINSAGVVQWTANGVAIATAANDQLSQMIASDGSGGAIITWEDFRGGNYDIYAQRINSAGVVQWTADGVAISTAASAQTNPMIATDGSGGAIVTWEDLRSSNFDIYAQRINSAGVVQWTANGVAISSAASTQDYQGITSDGWGGAIVTWEDYRSGNHDIYAQRINSAGVGQWTADGLAIATAANNQDYPTITSDGSSGAIITWSDFRNGTSYDIYAQKVDRHGILGNVAPSVVQVQDVINDQGGQVNVLWDPSYLDVWPQTTIQNYRIYRGVSESASNPAFGVLNESEYAKMETNVGPADTYMKLDDANETNNSIYWELVGTVPAEWLQGYSLLATTPSDSGPQGNAWYYFMVRARGASSLLVWDSNPDSGYSVDNLPPSAPNAPMGRVVSCTSANTHWNPNIVDPDVGNYKVYRGTTPNFAINQSNFIGTANDTLFSDNSRASGTNYWYRVATVDVHGNESTPTASFQAEQIKASVKGFLAGPFNATTNLMGTALKIGGYLATHFPSVSVPALAVDSVNIEMRSTSAVTGSTVRKFRPAWLINDGTIRDFYDTTKSYVEFDTLSGNYYLVMRHRNHLPVMTSLTEAVSYSAPAASYDFTLSQSSAWGTNAMQVIGSRFGLYSGDANESRIVTASDANLIFEQLNATGYNARDINLSGVVTAADANMVFANLNKASQVPSGESDSAVTSANEISAPEVFRLDQNYPNPFNPTTTIRFSVDRREWASLKIYDLLGKEVKTLFDGIADPGRSYTTRLDGGGLASGVYVYRLKTATKIDARRLMLLR
ncbi:MAG: T9SS type A sorting domain-containing protein [Ignavibacteriae bacterium]|nr:T9SS type A sorting domain-containing protein [Ignavibacteriota bacterium]